MMLYPAMNELLKQIPSRYKLVNVVAARARQIANEAEQEEIMLEDKPVSLAVREIAEGRLPEQMQETQPEEEPEEEE
ncbi:MAG: DNA-directed RNA polymerase subunit omega [Evtepia sp.]|uniref:DNA-directed RNA polymerase subunit omega n=1 Tax=Evtepia sp. TaxID=2773933 RepID=UPI002A759F74|nr:DNA-directed RNA polymerase subunit omega [Evtepia sp.]MDY3015134.1 DNA-directed RNA polymerase subunit omega [Evtepia sp.]